MSPPLSSRIQVFALEIACTTDVRGFSVSLVAFEGALDVLAFHRVKATRQDGCVLN